MTVAVKHKFQSSVPDAGGTTLVGPNAWNDAHSIQMASGFLLGRTAAMIGDVQELSATDVVNFFGFIDATSIQTLQNKTLSSPGGLVPVNGTPFADSVQATGLNGIQSKQFFIYKQYTDPPGTAGTHPSTEVSVLRVQRVANYTGGTAGNVENAIWGIHTVNANVANYEWTILGELHNNATAGENVAVVGSAYKNAAGPTWAADFILTDNNGADPIHGSVGVEIDLLANGTDANGGRCILDAIGLKNGSGTSPTISNGIRVRPGDASTTLTNAIAIGLASTGIIVNAIDFSVGNITTKIFNLTSGQKTMAQSDLGLVIGTNVVGFNSALGTPTSGTLTNCSGLPVSGITPSTVTALGVGSIELGNATDTTLSRSSAGVLAVEGVVVPTISSANTLTNKTIALGSNTVSGSAAQFNTACSDDNFAFLGAANTFTQPQTANSFIPSSATVPTNGLFLSAANVLGFAVNSSQKVWINSTGLGVGAAPAVPFQLSDASSTQLRLITTGANAVDFRMVAIDASSAAIFGTYSNADFAFYGNGAEVGRFKAAGGFSIGSTALNPGADNLGVKGCIASKAPVTLSGTTGSVGTADSSIIINSSGGFTLTLPSASSYPGRWLTIKTIAANAVTSASSNVVPIGSATAGTAILAATAGKFIRLQSDGTNWVAMEAN